MGPKRKHQEQVGAAPKKKESTSYLLKWEEEKELSGWLMRNPTFKTDPKNREARCSYCEVNLRAHHADLIKHSITASHVSAAEGYNRRKQKDLENSGVSVVGRETKKIELTLAVYIACHSAVRAVDHLTEALVSLGENTQFSKLRLHRTKCGKLIVNVVSPVLEEMLIKDIGDKKYSLIADESTDVSVMKYMAFCVRYFSEKRQTVVNEFLGFTLVERATGKDLSEGALRYLEKVGLDPVKMIGFGSDGAANMIGGENGMITHLRKVVPGVVLILCICYSLHLCASKAANEMPADLEFLVRESRNWFANSPLKRIMYEALYAAINRGDMPKKLVQLVKTRWLAWAPAVDALTNQWLELKTHFSIHVGSLKPGDKCTIGRKLNELYNDDSNLLLLLFLRSVTKEIANVNKAFQSNSVEVTKLFSDLRSLLVSTLRRFLKPSFIKVDRDGKFLNKEDFASVAQALNNADAYLPMDCVDYGASFTMKLNETRGIPADKVKEIQTRCIKYMATLCKELVDRLPINLHLFEKLRFLAPDECLKKHPHRPGFFSLPLDLRDPESDIDVLKSQWDKLADIDWTQHFPDGKIPTTSVEFWCGVFTYRNSTGYMFKDLALFALCVLSLPFSNAFVERVFSILNAVKTKARNKMSVDLLMALMKVRLTFGALNTCCNKFMPTEEMYKLFTNQIYETGKEAAEAAPSTSGSPAVEIDEFSEAVNLFSIEEDVFRDECSVFSDFLL